MRSTYYLQKCYEVQTERGLEYNKEGEQERSFAACANAFNAVTSRDLKGSDICLILSLLKMVRQNANPETIHEDSLLDCVSYTSLWAEELHTEIGDDNGQTQVG